MELLVSLLSGADAKYRSDLAKMKNLIYINDERQETELFRMYAYKQFYVLYSEDGEFTSHRELYDEQELLTKYPGIDAILNDDVLANPGNVIYTHRRIVSLYSIA